MCLTLFQHNDIVVLMIPAFQPDGNLPPGIHWLEWTEMEARFGQTAYRRSILAGFRDGIQQLKAAGCQSVYVDGSFVTAKPQPGDFDACWDVSGVDPNVLDPVFFDFSNHRAAQKARFLGEFFPAQLPEGGSGRTFLEFFQADKDSGDPKGIVALDLRRLP
jgi:hypothetical protein